MLKKKSIKVKLTPYEVKIICEILRKKQEEFLDRMLFDETDYYNFLHGELEKILNKLMIKVKI